jgi:hypothetical protein
MTTDERAFNQRGGPNLFHKIRVICKDKRNRDVFGITIPRNIAEQYIGASFHITTSDCSIILESGNKIEYLRTIKDRGDNNGENTMVE